MYYELCGVLSTSFGKKMLYYYVELCFSFMCAMLIFVSCMNVCMQFYIYYHPGFIKHGQISEET